MYSARLKIDTSVAGGSSVPPGVKSTRDQTIASASTRAKYPMGHARRLRSSSNASTSSSLSIMSPTSSSTNASTSSLQLPDTTSSPSDTKSRSSIDETVKVRGEYVLAMHDYAPQHQSATCLSFLAGQVIHVLNRDSSGWWDGELEGRRGWFPSNYVNVDISYLAEEAPKDPPQRKRLGHTHSPSDSSATSRASPRSSLEDNFRSSRPTSATDESGVDTYCPPLMVPLLHGLSLLQSAVRSNRTAHFQPSAACIISCIRSILSAIDCLPREAPLLQRYPILSQERKQILSALASLVSQAKRTSEDGGDTENHQEEVEAMLRIGGQVFAHMRRFLGLAVQCGVVLPDKTSASEVTFGSNETEGAWSRNGSGEVNTLSIEQGDAFQSNGHAQTHDTTPGSTLRAKSMVDLRRKWGTLTKGGLDSTEPMPQVISAPLVNQPPPRQHVLAPGHRANMLSISSTSSSSSWSSAYESPVAPARAPFPSGPSTAAQILDALQQTHDHYLSTIAAFIGHAHTHSRLSHASSTGYMYDLVREIVEMVCKLLTIVEAVMKHPDIPSYKLGNLRSAKEGLYNVTSSLAESVRVLTLALPPSVSEEDEKQSLLHSATGALKAGASCVAAVKVCLNRSLGEGAFVIQLPEVGDFTTEARTSSAFSSQQLRKAPSMSALGGQVDEDLTIQAMVQLPPRMQAREISSESDNSSASKSSSLGSHETNVTAPDEGQYPTPLVLPYGPVERDLPSPTTSLIRTDDGTTWEGSTRNHHIEAELGEKLINGDLPSVPPQATTGHVCQDPTAWMFSHDYAPDDVAYNGEGHLVGASIEALVEKMTPHDSIVDPAFSAVFFLTFRLFSSPMELVNAIIARYNLIPPANLAPEDVQQWQQRKGIPVRLRVSNFVKLWLEMYWRSAVDDAVLGPLRIFTRQGLGAMFPGPAQRILELIDIRQKSSHAAVSPKGDRLRDPGMSINPTSSVPASETPRPLMTKTLLAALRSNNFGSIAITDFDPLELARQLTVMECKLYCAIQPEEVLETGQERAKTPVNVRAVSTLSTVITGWVAESILDEHDIKKRTYLVKFFIKVADRCLSLYNFSTPRSIQAALDSSTISRLHQTWSGLPQKNKLQLDQLRKLADHGRNYAEYRSRLRNTAPPAVPFLGLYLTDVTFCREGNPSYRASPLTPSKKLLNFNKYHKLARIVQDMQRFQVPYNLKAIPEVQTYLNMAFEKSKHHGDLHDLYRRSLLVEPKQPADTAPASDVRQLFNWATRSQPPSAT